MPQMFFLTTDILDINKRLASLLIRAAAELLHIRKRQNSALIFAHITHFQLCMFYSTYFVPHSQTTMCVNIPGMKYTPVCLSEHAPAAKRAEKKKKQRKLFRQSINLFNSIKYQVQLKHFPF